MEDVEGLVKVSKLEDDEFKVLLSQVIAKILNRKEDNLIATLEGAAIAGTYVAVEDNHGNRNYKHAFAALCTLILEIVKNGVRLENEESETWKLLKEAPISMSADRIESIFEAIERDSSDIENRLCDCSSALNLDRVVDVQWRMDYQVRSSITGKLSEPIYYVKLKTVNERNELGPDTTFQCSLQQLEDLVHQLQDAEKQVERILTS